MIYGDELCAGCGHDRVHHDASRCWVWVKQKRRPHGCRCPRWTE